MSSPFRFWSGLGEWNRSSEFRCCHWSIEVHAGHYVVSRNATYVSAMWLRVEIILLTVGHMLKRR